MKKAAYYQVVWKKGLHFGKVCAIIAERYAPVAQLDRVTDYESVGRGFESLLAYQLKSPENLDYSTVFRTFSFPI